MPAQRIDAAAGASHVAQQQLRHGRGADDLRTVGMLRPADRINNGADLFHVSIFANGGVHVIGLGQLVLRDSRDARNHLRRITREMLLHQLEDATRMFQRKVVSGVGRQRRRRRGSRSGFRPYGALRLVTLPRGSVRPCGLGWGIARSGFCGAIGCCRTVTGRDGRSGRTSHVSALFVVPRRNVVLGARRVKTGKEPVFRQFEALLHDQGRVRVVGDVLLGVAIVLQRIIDQTAKESDIRARADLAEMVGLRGRPLEAWINHDNLGVADALGFHNPFEPARMIFRRVTAHDQHHVGVFDIHPAIGHCTASERWSQT